MDCRFTCELDLLLCGLRLFFNRKYPIVFVVSMSSCEVELLTDNLWSTSDSSAYMAIWLGVTIMSSS